MANKRLYSVCAVNLRVHPHPEGVYEELFKFVMALKRSISVHGMTHVLMTSMKRDSIAGHEVLYGSLSKYTKIKLDGKWFNESEMRVAEEEELMEINIPDYLQPNLTEFRFALFPKKHVVFVEFEADGEKLSPRLIGRYFDSLFSASRIVEKFGVVDVTVVPDVNAVSEILALPVIKKVEMKIKRPNPDDLDDIDDEDFDEKTLRIMDEQNISEVRQLYVARRGASLVLNEASLLKAELASKNGEVIVSGRDINGNRAELSTADRPMVERSYFDSDYHGYGAFVELVLNMLPRILVRRNG